MIKRLPVSECFLAMLNVPKMPLKRFVPFLCSAPNFIEVLFSDLGLFWVCPCPLSMQRKMFESGKKLKIGELIIRRVEIFMVDMMVRRNKTMGIFPNCNVKSLSSLGASTKRHPVFSVPSIKLSFEFDVFHTLILSEYRKASIAILVS
jgi:hypothetical protein